MSVLGLAVAHKHVSMLSVRLKELRRVLKCPEVWENGYALAQFRQHNRVTLANKDHRKVRTARQVLYPVELQTCGQHMQRILFPLSSASHCSPWVAFLLMTDLCCNRLKLHKNSFATLSTVCLKNGPAAYLHACSCHHCYLYSMLHIEKATYGQRRPPRWHVDSLKQNTHRSRAADTALEAGACLRFLGMSSRRLEAWEDLGWAEARNICRSKRAREGEKKRNAVCADDATAMQWWVQDASWINTKPQEEKPSISLSPARTSNCLLEKSCPETQV